jgi:hypothetical protein
MAGPSDSSVVCELIIFLHFVEYRSLIFCLAILLLEFYLDMSCFNFLECLLYTVHASQAYNSIGSTKALYTGNFAYRLMPLLSHTVLRNLPKAVIALAI